MSNINRYENYESMIQAVKQRARDKGLLDSNTERDFLFSRYLYRVFTFASEDFVLKGGQSMLAKVPNARTTQDIDFALSDKKELECGIELLQRAGQVEAEDFLRYELVRVTNIEGGGISSSYDGRSLHFEVYGGLRRVGNCQVDLAAGCIITDTPTEIFSRRNYFIDLPQSPYRIYPTVDHISDKFCATIEDYNGRESSRMKDLVDLVLIACSENIDAEKLDRALSSELKRRGLQRPSSFSAPESWKAIQKKLVPYLPSTYSDIETATKLVRSMIDPILSGGRASGTWSPRLLEWTDSPTNDE